MVGGVLQQLTVKYLGLVTAFIAAFVYFVACGSQLYQVSLVGDHDEKKISADATDPDSARYGLHAPEGWAKLPIPFVIDAQMSEEQQEGLKTAMALWETAVGKRLFEFKGKDSKSGDSFRDLYGSLADNTNGNYLDQHWQKTGKAQVVLATTIWDINPANSKQIKTADIRFNDEFYIIGDSYRAKLKAVGDTREYADMVTLALHETGHFLGLTHIEKDYDRYSIMNPTIYIGEGLANRQLSCGDIARIQQIYGCAGAACEQQGCDDLNNITSSPGDEADQ